MQCECPERAPIPCDTSDLHAPCCAAQQLACVPGPKPRRETRDANAEEATGEKQLLRLERPFQTAGPTYNVIQNARGFLTKLVMRCRARLTAPLGRAQPPLSTTPYFWAHPDGSAVRKRNTRTVIVVAGAATAAHDPPTRAADASRLSARCHQLSSKPARARAQWRIDRFRRFKRRLKRTGPRPDDEHGPRIRFELHVWAFVCIGSTVTTLRPDFRAPVARRVVGLRSQFRVEALVWPLSEGIRTRHCHLRHRVSPTEPGDRCESASVNFQTGEATTDNVYRCASCHSEV